MWTKTIQTKFKGQTLPIQVWLSDSTGDNAFPEIVSIQAMLNEYYLIEKLAFENRDAAYDFIKCFTVQMASSFILRTAYTVGAVE